MEFMDFLGGCDTAAWQMLSVLDAADRAFVRLDDAGRIIALTDRAEELLRQPPLRSIYEVLGELAARTIRIAIRRHENMRTRAINQPFTARAADRAAPAYGTFCAGA